MFSVAFRHQTGQLLKKVEGRG